MKSMTSIFYNENQFEMPLPKEIGSLQSLFIQTNPLSNTSVQILISPNSNPKPSGDIFRISFNEKEILHYLSLKGIGKLSVKENEEKERSSDEGLQNQEQESNQSSPDQLEELENLLPFEIDQILGNRLDESMSLAIYRIASFGLKLMQISNRILFKEIFVVWGIKMKEMEQEDIHSIVKTVEQALEMLQV